ncbi:MAG TPA: hypothetical protein DD490_02695, partial [Acidobacteria bacterium]|nr:hypothetical protein [Acidobacteriota bacterium]
MSSLRREDGASTNLARSVARHLDRWVVAMPFEAADDPRNAEHALGRFAYRWVLALLGLLWGLGA